MAGRLGQQLGNYRLLQLLGTGGFAEVYLGEHTYLDTRAAIKVLHSQLAENDIELFRVEARTVAHLVHPSIIRVLEFGIDGRTPFLVMDYATNGTLRRMYPRGSRLSAKTVISYTRQVAAALQYAHDQKIIHRDVKPENLFVGSKGEILLGDFGIALVAQSMLYQGVPTAAGTVAYMAPEQIEGLPWLASDQYALAIIVYEWLTGERPFEGVTFMEVAVKHCTIPPPSLRARVNTISPAAEMVVLKALAKDPRQRFPSVVAFAAALEHALLDAPTLLFDKPSLHGLSGQPSSTGSSPDALMANSATVLSPIREPHLPPSLLLSSNPTTLAPYAGPSPEVVTKLDPATSISLPLRSRHLSRRNVLLGLAGLGLGTATVGTTLLFLSHPAWFQHAQSRSASPTPSSPTVGRQLLTYTGHKGPIYALGWSPDHQLLASGGADEQVHVWSAQNGALSTIYTGHSESVNALAWFPGTNHDAIIASASADATVQVWRVADKTIIATFKKHTTNIRTVSWSPDGSLIASADDRGNLFIWQVSAVETPQTISAQTRIWSVAWSPDNTMLAWGGDDGIVHVWGVTEQKELFTYDGHRHSNTSSQYVKTLCWSPDSMQIASGSDDDTVHIWSVQPGAAHQIIIYKGHRDVLNSVAWSPNAAFVASGSGDHTVQVWNPIKNHLVFTYEHHHDAIHTVLWSSDSQQIASSSDDMTVQVWKAPAVSP